VEVCSCLACFEAEQYLLRKKWTGRFHPLLTEVLIGRFCAQQVACGYLSASARRREVSGGVPGLGQTVKENP